MGHEITVRTTDLAKQYGSFWALKDCTITVPQGSITALVGPNGAGKTTLLKIIASLNQPSKGDIAVFGNRPDQSSAYLGEIGYLAQEIPLYGQLTAEQHSILGEKVNPRWDTALARDRLERLGVPLDRVVGKLSGGQRAQVGLTLALAKKPKLLLLDEPVAALDPLARTDFIASLAQASAAAEGDLTIIMSSHLLSDLERICDRVIILAAGETQLCDEIEHVLETHEVLVGSSDMSTVDPAFTVIREIRSANQVRLLVRLEQERSVAKSWHREAVEIEEVVLAYMSRSKEKATTGGKI